MRAIGITGHSGAGKTTLLVKLIPIFTEQGLRVATIKHAHRGFDIDLPGKDSYEHRKAGATETIISSAQRTAQIREHPEEAEPSLAILLRQLDDHDLALVEGYKSTPLPKLEVWRSAVSAPPLAQDNRYIFAVASDSKPPAVLCPVLPLNDTEALVQALLEQAVEQIPEQAKAF